MKRTLENESFTEETVKDLGEKIAMMAVRKLAALSSGLLDNLYKGLICDYLHRDEVRNKIEIDAYLTDKYTPRVKLFA